ncbi:MAG: hypothetical protein BGP11_18175 [Rhodobacterales bacterium 65-51]|nr:MAG: hypothetical protein BGP11_18175 [Rhodobacterales bacterium 65-51]
MRGPILLGQFIRRNTVEQSIGLLGQAIRRRSASFQLFRYFSQRQAKLRKIFFQGNQVLEK